jgi:branched-subunit amino acid transport protein AzlD
MAVAVACLITYFTRAFPFLLYSGKRHPSSMVLYLGRVLPPAIMAVLVVYCLKDVRWIAPPFGLPETLCCALVLGVQQWRRNAMLSIALGTVAYMVWIQVLA